MKRFVPRIIRPFISFYYHKIKTQIKYLCESMKKNEKTKKIYPKNLQKIFMIGSPAGINLGDHAITIAQMEFLSQFNNDYEIFDISIPMFWKHLGNIKKSINNNDFFMIQGGGNIGNHYILAEDIRRTVIKNFPKNLVISFPQTIYFTDNYAGQKEFDATKKIYGKHKRLWIVARENQSYSIMKKAFPMNNVMLTPDIVFILNKTMPRENRNGVLLCLRNDIESILTPEEIALLENISRNNYTKLQYTDTCVKNNISKKERSKSVEKKFGQFRRAELVVTDRLHGMVMCAITSTPCIVMNNYNHKVKGTYEWVKHLNYIKFIDDIDLLEQSIAELKKIKVMEYDNSFASLHFQKISDIIVENIKGEVQNA